MNKCILIGGYYGAGNVGDEAILAAMIGGLRAQHPDLTFIVTSWEPEKTSRELDVQAVYWKDINALLDAAVRADMIILGGGGIFHDYWGIDPDTYLRKDFWDITAFGSLPLLAKLLGMPCMIYAVGVGPFQTELAGQHTRLAFERCQVATLRDDESLEVLKRTGFDVQAVNAPFVKVLPDPVFSLPTTPSDEMDVTVFLRRRQVTDDVPLLGVSLRYWDLTGPLEEWLPFVANGVKQFLKKNEQAQAVLIPFQVLNATPHTNDAIVLQKLADLIDMPGRVIAIDVPLSPRFAQALIKRCKVIVGMRLHSVIMGINVGTPVVALSYAPKVWSVMKRAGLGKFCNESLMTSPDILSAQIKEAWDGGREFRVTVRGLQEELRAETKGHTDLALDLLSQSRRSEPQFSQEFALHQTRLLLQVDEKLKRLQEEKFGVEQYAHNLSNQLAQREQTLNSYTERLAQLQANSQQMLAQLQSRLADKEYLLNEIQISKTWKLALFLRRIRILLAPPDNRFLKTVKQKARAVFSPLQRVRRNWKLKENSVLIKNSGLFDEVWYLERNPDVARAGVDPVLHYLKFGGFEARDPGPQFSSSWYLAANDDVMRAGVNPLAHYLRYGKTENRAPLPPVQRLPERKIEQAVEPPAQLMPVEVEKTEGEVNSFEIVNRVVDELNSRALHGVVVITSTFTFNELYNQRDINLCKSLSAKGWGVVFIAWRWNKQEAMQAIGEEVYKNIFQLPKDMLLDHADSFSRLQTPGKYFIIEFPHPDFLPCALRLRRYNFKIVYEIIDEWEEFHKVNHASWFNKSIESAIVVNANILTAVSQPLIEKFLPLRNDIYLSPNGYSSALLGEKHLNIACQQQVRKGEMHLGYFGYLADAWFDWDFLYKILILAERNHIKLFLHLIGYGEPDLNEKLAGFMDQVHFHGKVHPSELYKYAKDWDAALICFKSGKLSETVDPIKVYEYLYFGLPIIVKGIEHLKDFPSAHVVADEFHALEVITALHDEGLKGGREMTPAAERMLARSTWEQRFTDLVDFLEIEKWTSL